MSFDSWMLFCATTTVICFTPGPAVMLVISLSLTRGWRAGFPASLGILAGNAFYFLLSATGVGAVVLASWELFVLIKWLGAAYLVWLGARMLLSAGQGLALEETPGRRRASPFLQGLLTQGANPNALPFFMALLPQFISPTAPVAWQVMILGVSSTVIELIALAVYVAVCHRARHVVSRPRFATWLNRVSGSLLIWAGVRMARIRAS